MKNVLKIFAIVAVIGFSFAACDNGGGGGGAPSPVTIDGNFIGTWTGIMSDKWGSYTAVITVTNTTWVQYVEGYYYDDGYFTSWNGTSIYSNFLKKVAGTITVIDATHATLVLNSNAIFPGTYVFTKRL